MNSIYQMLKNVNSMEYNVFVYCRFVRRINCEEDASSVEMLNAFNKYRELYIHDVRLSFKDLITLIHNMINKYDWDHIVYFLYCAAM